MTSIINVVFLLSVRKHLRHHQLTQVGSYFYANWRQNLLRSNLILGLLNRIIKAQQELDDHCHQKRRSLIEIDELGLYTHVDFGNRYWT